MVWLTARDMAVALRIDGSQLSQLCEDEELPYHRIGDEIRFNAAEVMQAIRKRINERQPKQQRVSRYDPDW